MADAFEQTYGHLVRTEYSGLQTARTLKTALAQRTPPITVTDGPTGLHMAQHGVIWLHTAVPNHSVGWLPAWIVRRCRHRLV